MIEGYRYENSPEIRGWLVSHPELYAALEKARPKLEEFFPGDSVRLEVVNDPDGSTDLFAKIKTKRPPKDTRSRLNAFTRWNVGSGSYSPNVTFGIDYR